MLKLCTARHHKAPRGTKAYYMPKPYKRRGHRQLADSRELWSGRKDLNLRPLGPDPSRLFGRAQAQIKRIHRCAVAVDTPSFPAARRTLSPRTDANTDSPTTSLGRPSRCPLALARANPAFTRSAIRARSNSAMAPRMCICSFPRRRRGVDALLEGHDGDAHGVSPTTVNELGQFTFHRALAAFVRLARRANWV